MPTPVWFALLDDRRLVASTEERTAKVRRIRRDPRARVFPCDPRGKPLGPGVEGTARILENTEHCERAETALDRHCGRTRRIYEKLLTPEEGIVYLEVAAQRPRPTNGLFAIARLPDARRDLAAAASGARMASDETG